MIAIGTERDDCTKTPTKAELELLQVLWKIGEGTVRDVLDALPDERRPAYTTVLTILRILTDKGFLERHRVSRADVYRPKDTRKHVERGIVRDLLERVFGGSSRRLLVHLVDDGALSLEEIRQLEDVLDTAPEPHTNGRTPAGPAGGP